MNDTQGFNKELSNSTLYTLYITGVVFSMSILTLLFSISITTRAQILQMNMIKLTEITGQYYLI